tara:strand:- start:2016 stop:2480 length:465 start_codon:yes stop_codon:yes gene_type:complete
MANTKLGNTPSWSGQTVEKLDSTKQLEPGDSGKIFMIDLSVAAFDVNLPQLSSNIAGWNCKFMTQTSGSVDCSVLGYGLPTAGGSSGGDNDVMVYNELSLEGGDSSSARTSSADGFTIEAASVKGDYWDVFTDGSLWYVTAVVHEVAHSTAIDS